MLKLSKRLVQGMAFMPERSRRFFTLKVILKKEIPLSQKIVEQHQKWLKAAQQKGQIIFAVKGKESAWFQYLFQSPNEIQPYNFIRKSVIYTQNLVQKYEINEVQMQLKIKDKELAPSYLRQ